MEIRVLALGIYCNLLLTFYNVQRIAVALAQSFAPSVLWVSFAARIITGQQIKSQGRTQLKQKQQQKPKKKQLIKANANTRTHSHTLCTHTYTHIGIETMVRILVFFGGFFLSFFWLDSRVHSTMNPHPWTHPPVRFDWLKTTTATTTTGRATKLCNSLQHFAYVCGICFLLFPPVFLGVANCLLTCVNFISIKDTHAVQLTPSLSLSLLPLSICLFWLGLNSFGFTFILVVVTIMTKCLKRAQALAAPNVLNVLNTLIP